jgi:hypothetical protein
MVTVVRAIGTPLIRAEAFDPADAAREAAMVLGFHPQQRYREVTFRANGAPPTRVPRWLYVRALVALAADATRAGGDAAPPVTVTLDGDGDWLVAGARDRARNALSSYGRELAAAMAGEPLHGALGFRVPTLAAIRRREGR